MDKYIKLQIDDAYDSLSQLEKLIKRKQPENSNIDDQIALLIKKILAIRDILDQLFYKAYHTLNPDHMLKPDQKPFKGSFPIMDEYKNVCTSLKQNKLSKHNAFCKFIHSVQSYNQSYNNLPYLKILAELYNISKHIQFLTISDNKTVTFSNNSSSFVSYNSANVVFGSGPGVIIQFGGQTLDINPQTNQPNLNSPNISSNISLKYYLDLSPTRFDTKLKNLLEKFDIIALLFNIIIFVEQVSQNLYEFSVNKNFYTYFIVR